MASSDASAVAGEHARRYGASLEHVYAHAIPRPAPLIQAWTARTAELRGSGDDVAQAAAAG